MTMPPDSDRQLRAWGEALVADAARADDPYIVNSAVKERLAQLPAGSSEREAIYDLLIEWLASPDLNRWHPALMVLLDEGVARSASAVRDASVSADTDEKRSFASVFEQVANELENPVVIDVDPTVRLRWEQFEAAVFAAAEILPNLPGGRVRRSAVENLLSDGDYVNALLFGAGAVPRSDGDPTSRQVAELLIPEFKLLLGDDGDDVTDRDRAALEQSLDRLRSVVGAQTTGRAVPPNFREQFEAGWDAMRQGGNLDLMTAHAEERLDALAADALERHWIHEILIGWLFSDDQWRWQAALMLLQRERVPESPEQMRFAAAFARLPEKRAFADAFTRTADELEQLIKDDGAGAETS